MSPAAFDFFGRPQFHAVCFALVCTAAIQALVAIWAATSRRHWFWRALAVWAAVMALAPIRAYEPAIIFAISSALTVGLIIAVAVRDQVGPEVTRERVAGIRYTLRDLLLLMIIVGLWLTGVLHLVRNIQRPVLANLALSIAALTVISVGAYACVFSRRRRLASCFVVVSIAIFAAAIPTLGSWSETYDALSVLNVSFDPSFDAPSFCILALAFSELAFLLIFSLFLAQASAGGLAAESRIVARWLPSFVAAVVAVPLAAIYWQMLWLDPLLPPFSTAPNHYPRLLEIARQVKTLATATPSAAAPQERTSLIAEVLMLADFSNYVPHDPNPSPSRVNVDVHLEDGRTFRDLGRAMESEAGAALARGDEQEALQLRLAIVRLGVMLQRGAEEPMYLVGRAVEGVALLRLVECRRKLSPDDARAVLQALEQANTARENPEITVQRDRAVAERAYGWGSRLDNVLESFGFGSDVYPSYLQVTKERYEIVRRLETDLALRQYRHDHGKFPAALADLVPDYLRTVPIDGHSKQPLRYRAGGDDFTLYSVGQDRIDNGGKFTNMRTYYSGVARGDHTRFGAGYDLDLDTVIRP